MEFNVELLASLLVYHKSLYTGGVDFIGHLKTVGTPPTSLGAAA